MNTIKKLSVVSMLFFMSHCAFAAVQAKDPVHKNWGANITGADDYERVK